jgi:hypothetical protein
VSECSAVCCIVVLGLNRVIVSAWIFSGEEQGEGFIEGGECAEESVSSRFPPSVSTLTHCVSKPSKVKQK